MERFAIDRVDPVQKMCGFVMQVHFIAREQNNCRCIIANISACLESAGITLPMSVVSLNLNNFWVRIAAPMESVGQFMKARNEVVVLSMEATFWVSSAQSLQVKQTNHLERARDQSVVAFQLTGEGRTVLDRRDITHAFLNAVNAAGLGVRYVTVQLPLIEPVGGATSEPLAKARAYLVEAQAEATKSPSFSGVPSKLRFAFESLHEYVNQKVPVVDDGADDDDDHGDDDGDDFAGLATDAANAALDSTLVFTLEHFILVHYRRCLRQKVDDYNTLTRFECIRRAAHTLSHLDNHSYGNGESIVPLLCLMPSLLNFYITAEAAISRCEACQERKVDKK